MIRAILALLLLPLSLAALALSQSSPTSPPATNTDPTTSQPPESSKPQGTQKESSSIAPAPGDSAHIEVVSKQKADYPLAAEKEKLQGEVLLKLFVSETGDVERTELVSGDPILARAAIKSAMKWKFKPFIRGGKPIKVATTIPFDFAFSDKIKDTTPPQDATETGGDTGVARISSGVSLGLLIHRVTPVYPESARRARIEGIVVLSALIGKDGRVENLTPITGPKELTPAAIGAVQQWRYKPYLLGGQAVSVKTQIVVNFQLQVR